MAINAAGVARTLLRYLIESESCITPIVEKLLTRDSSVIDHECHWLDGCVIFPWTMMHPLCYFQHVISFRGLTMMA